MFSHKEKAFKLSLDHEPGPGFSRQKSFEDVRSFAGTDEHD